MLHNLKKLWCIFCCKDESHIVSDIHVPRNSVNYITKDGGQGNKKWLVNMSWKSPWVIQLLHMLGLSLKLRENPYVFTLWYYNCKLSKPKYVPGTGFALALDQFYISLKIENVSNTFFRNCNMHGPTVYVFLFASNIWVKSIVENWSRFSWVIPSLKAVQVVNIWLAVRDV